MLLTNLISAWIFVGAPSEPRSLAYAEAPAYIGAHPHAKVRIGDRDYWFFLDSAAFVGTIDPAVAKQIPGVTVQDTHLRSGTKRFYKVPSLAIGGARLRNQFFYENRGKWGSIGKKVPGTDEKVVGSIGYNVLRLLSLGIDFRKGRIFAWPPADGEEHLLTLYGAKSRYKWLSAIYADPDTSVPLVPVEFSGTPDYPILDTGTLRTVLSVEVEKAVGKRMAHLGRRAVGTKSERIGFLDKLKVGPIEWDHSFVSVANDPTDPSLLGWASLCPLGVVMLDFSDGSMYMPSDARNVGFLDWILSIYRARVEGGDLLIQEQYRLPVGMVRSILGQPVRNAGELLSSESWTPRKRGAKALESMVTALKHPDRQVGTYEWEGERESFHLYSLTSAGRRKLPWPVGSHAEDVPYEHPGYYIVMDGRVSLLPAGPIWIPRGEGWVAQIGGVPAMAEPRAKEGYKHSVVPEMPEKAETFWNRFGWKVEKRPMFVSPKGAVSYPVLTKEGVQVPEGHAVAAAKARLEFRSGKLFLRAR